MMREIRRRVPGRPWRFAGPLMLLFVAVLAGCGLRGGGAGAAEDEDVACPEFCTYDADAVHALIAFHRETRDLDSAALQRLQRALGEPGGRPVEQVRQAMLLSHPRATADLARALALLDAVLASRSEDAIAVHSLASLLVGELHERLRLSRLAERGVAQLRASEQARAALKEKLDALAEIERSLPARPLPDAAIPDVQPQTDERKGAQ